MKQLIGRKRTTQYRWIAVLFTLITIIMLMGQAGAATPSGVTPKAIIQENQIDTSKTYFDLKLEPRESKTIQLSVHNGDDYPVIAHVALNTAKTGIDGLIIYTVADEDEQKDESMPIAIGEIAQVKENDKRIEPGDSVLFDIEITMPDEAFEGILLGGLVTTATYTDDANIPEDNQENPIAIENQYAYVIGLRICNEETEVAPELELVSIDAGLTNYHPDVKVYLRNKTAGLAKNMQVDAKVYREGASSPLYALNLESAEMAPQSKGAFAISWQDNKMDAGTYRLTMTVKWNEKEWSWDETFVIEGEIAKEVNDEAVDMSEAKSFPWIIVAIGCGVLLIAIIIVLVIKLKKKETREAELD